MLVYKRSCDLPKSLTLTLIKCFLCFLGITGVDGQAFTFSQITLSRPKSAVNASLQASCNATYLASTPFVMDWRINNTVVGLYQITNNMVPQLANGTHHYDVVFSAPTTAINTGNTFEVNLEIRNLKLNDNQAAISVTCTNCVQVSTLINVTECQLDNSNGVIASDVVSPCGLGCQVQYSCEIGYNGPIINATCLANATFDATPSCVQITCPAKNICSQPQYCFDVTMSNYNTTVLGQCAIGYNGTVTATCGIDSNWDVSSQCQAICNISDISSNKALGRCASETGSVLQGSNVYVTCCEGFNGAATVATCLSNRMWDNLPICNRIPGNIDSNATFIKLPTNQATIATEVTGLELSTGDISSPRACAWTYNPGLPAGFEFYHSSFGGCASSTTATYSISCSKSSGVVSSNLTFLTPLTSNVSVVMKCSPSPTYNLQVIVKDCTSPTPSNIPVNPPTGVYNTPAHFQCPQNSNLFYKNGTTGNTATKCLASAEWENENIVQCWSAPTATLIGNNTHCVGDKATFQCNAVGGFPLTDRVEVYFNGQIQALKKNRWISTALTSSNNGDIVECRAISKYTSIDEYSHLGKDKKILTVNCNENPQLEKSHVRQAPVGSIDEGYVEVNHPQNLAYQNIGQKSTVEPSTSNYKNFRNNVSVVRGNAGNVELNALDQNLEAGTGVDNGGYETVMVKKDSKKGYENVSFPEKSSENMSPKESRDTSNPP